MTSTKIKYDAIRRAPLALMGPVVLAGISLAVHLTLMKLWLLHEPDYQSGCNFGQGLNCEVNQLSSYSDIMGVPIAVWAIPTYLLMAFLAGFALIKGRGDDSEVDQARNAIDLLFVLGLTATLYSAFLAYVSYFVLEAFCPYCLGMYGVNLAILFLAFFAANMSFKHLWMRLKGHLNGLQPAPQAFVVFALTFAAAFVWYQRADENIQKEAAQNIALRDAQQKQELEKKFFQDSTDSSRAKPNTEQAAQSEKVTPSTETPAPPPSKDTRGFNPPIGPMDFAWGPEDAPVTLVEFADFECSFCRLLSLNLKPIKEKFPKQVRVVFKHYPMNGECNQFMGTSRMHESACDAAKGAICAGMQGKFWEMHDLLYKNQTHLDPASIEARAKELSLDIPAWKQCLSNPAVTQKIRQDVQLAAREGINGTPRLYINGRLISGAASTSIIEYMVNMSLKQDGPGESVAPLAPTTQTPAQVEISHGETPFYIDTFEASVDKNGRAQSLSGVPPARLSWFDAQEACKASNKRLCSEEEWVTACAGEAAIDNNRNGYFADDTVEGSMYPYGAFYEAARCLDDADKYEGEPNSTGSYPGCRTSTGVYDLTGNVSEWVGATQQRATLLGGDYRSKQRAACNKRSSMFGAGYRNKSTGFRCCSDSAVSTPTVSKSGLDTSSSADVIGQKMPESLSLETADGEGVSRETFKGRLTYLTFFASWCGSCKRELPALRKLQEEYSARGFQVIAIGTDRSTERSQSFADQYDPNYAIAYDPDSKAMGFFKVDAMPASFLIDNQGVIKDRMVGFRPEQLPEIKEKIEGML
jgi:protein-disulfide isomerase/uncharacterized membrane protein/peroxiredoxin